MKNERSELEQLQEVIRKNNFSIPEVIQLINDTAQASVGLSNPAEDIITLTVDYSRSLKEMIEAGKYDDVYSEITEKNYPLPTELNGKKVTLFAKLFCFNGFWRTHNFIYHVLPKIRKAGYRPADLPELLALGEKYPRQQCQFPVVALGTMWPRKEDSKNIFTLSYRDYKRELKVDSRRGGWDSDTFFLCIRK